MNRGFLFGTNFKMNQTPAETALFLTDLAGLPLPRRPVQRFVIPPFTSLPAAAEARAASPGGANGAGSIWIGAQNMHEAAAGAFTGEISAPMLTALGVDLVLLGHAERRTLFGETDLTIQPKVAAALAADLRVLLCVGESAEEKRIEIGPETVARQLKIALHGLDPAAADRLQIAYEPVWSIGADGIPAGPDDIAPIAALIRDLLVDRLGAAGRAVPILYGGSVSPQNAASFANIAEIGGLFVGRAAWTVAGFNAVLAAALADDRQAPSARG